MTACSQWRRCHFVGPGRYRLVSRSLCNTHGSAAQPSACPPSSDHETTAPNSACLGTEGRNKPQNIFKICSDRRQIIFSIWYFFCSKYLRLFSVQWEKHVQILNVYFRTFKYSVERPLPSWDLPLPARTLQRSTVCHQRSHSSACSTAGKKMGTPCHFYTSDHGYGLISKNSFFEDDWL